MNFEMESIGEKDAADAASFQRVDKVLSPR